MRFYRVHEVAKELGCSETWLRRSEQRGHIPKARRDLNRWRIYTQADVAILREILVPPVPGDVESTNSTKRRNQKSYCRKIHSLRSTFQRRPLRDPG